jgi:hypothetical protein
MTREEYRERANQCMRMARWAREPQRSELNELATAWLELAEEGVTLVPADPILSPTTNKKRRINAP